MQLLGTGLWDDPRIFSDAALDGGWYAAPDSAGFRNFSARYRARYGQDPVRTATLAYDAVALVAALVKTQGAQRFSEQVLTNSSGFAGIDGVFRFRPDGTNERGLAVLRVTPSGGQVVSPAPKSFAPGTDFVSWRASNPVSIRARAKTRQIATTASSTGKSALRHAQAAVGGGLHRAFVAQDGNALGIERAAGERREALGIDAFGEPQPHQQEFVGHFAGLSFSSTIRPLPAASTRISQLSGRFSVSVA